MNKGETLGPSPQVAHGPWFQYVSEVSGVIEPYRAMPLLAISNTLNANGLATGAPQFREDSCRIERAGGRAVQVKPGCGIDKPLGIGVYLLTY